MTEASLPRLNAASAGDKLGKMQSQGKTDRTEEPAKTENKEEVKKMKIKDIKTPGELYDAMMNATTPAERDHHASDLYIKVTPDTMRIVDRYEFSSQVSSFRDQTDLRRALWYEIPFAYLPYWQGQRD